MIDLIKYIVIYGFAISYSVRKSVTDIPFNLGFPKPALTVLVADIGPWGALARSEALARVAFCRLEVFAFTFTQASNFPLHFKPQPVIFGLMLAHQNSIAVFLGTSFCLFF
jgi:hypothetical protein